MSAMWKEGAGDSAELLWVEEASPADLLAAVRAAVDSGTIEGEVVTGELGENVLFLDLYQSDSGYGDTYLLIGPIL